MNRLGCVAHSNLLLLFAPIIYRKQPPTSDELAYCFASFRPRRASLASLPPSDQHRPERARHPPHPCKAGTFVASLKRFFQTCSTRRRDVAASRLAREFLSAPAGLLQ